MEIFDEAKDSIFLVFAHPKNQLKRKQKSVQVVLQDIIRRLG
jgi:hypothetical protein